MDKKALYKLTYGLFLLTAQEDGKDNGCIINTAVQVANDPVRISIAVLKANKTHDMVRHTGVLPSAACPPRHPLSCSATSACSPDGTWINSRTSPTPPGAKTASTT